MEWKMEEKDLGPSGEDASGALRAGRLKFRAWNGDMMSEPFHPWELHDDGSSVITREGVSVHWAGYPYAWMQWTGLKDKNGRDIYEGDILCEDGRSHFEVRWGGVHGYEIGFGLVHGSKSVQYPGWNRGVLMEVVGNIYENPELVGHL